jgi:hypothetical protein
VDGQERLQAGTPVEVHNASPTEPAVGSGGVPAPSKDSDHSSEPKNKRQGKQN